MFRLYEGIVVPKRKDRSNDRVTGFRERKRQAARDKARALAGPIVDGLSQQRIGKFLAMADADEKLALEYWAIATGELLTVLPRHKRIAIEACRYTSEVYDRDPDPFEVLRPRLEPLKARNGRAPDWYTQRNDVLERLERQLVWECKHDGVFSDDATDLWWHIKAMQARPRSWGSKLRWPEITPELRAGYLAADAEEAHRNKLTLQRALRISGCNEDDEECAKRAWEKLLTDTIAEVRRRKGLTKKQREALARKVRT